VRADWLGGSRPATDWIQRVGERRGLLPNEASTRLSRNPRHRSAEAARRPAGRLPREEDSGASHRRQRPLEPLRERTGDGADGGDRSARQRSTSGPTSTKTSASATASRIARCAPVAGRGWTSGCRSGAAGQSRGTCTQRRIPAFQVSRTKGIQGSSTDMSEGLRFPSDAFDGGLCRRHPIPESKHEHVPDA
jgi:hypothetical protein